MKISAEVQAFQGRLGHQFAQPELLIRALTHSSISSQTRPDNQRLEFLGDRVLGLAVSEALFRADVDASEGKMAPRFNALVRKETCADVAAEIELGVVLKLGRSEMLSGGRRKHALLADALEAVIAAVYLDAGFETARKVVLNLWDARINSVAEDARDAKTALQEWAQARGQTPPAYVETSRSGPDHAPIFAIEVRLASGESAQGKAATKRRAEQIAAGEMLAQMEGD
ncbi:MAG: ribonuclease III [Marinosulfonomonas sp.]|nr:ribonuclease III [Marinosulfonomonas sp.]